MVDLIMAHDISLNREFASLWVALVTPLKENGTLDLPTFQSLLTWHRSNHSSGLLICGSTGEAGLLSFEEYQTLLREASKILPAERLMAGASGQTVPEVLELCQAAKEVGIKTVLIAPPSYVKPSQEALVHHYTQIHNQIDQDILLYDVPSRTGVQLSDETILILSKLPRIVGLKDATGIAHRPMDLKSQGLGDDFLQFSGEDLTTPAYLGQGGYGVVTVTGNIFPQKMTHMIKAFHAGETEPFLRLQKELHPVHSLVFARGNPVSIKAILAMAGVIQETVRPPLLPVNTSDPIRTELKKLAQAIELSGDLLKAAS